MGLPAQSRVDIDDFAGWVDGVDPRDIPPGGAEVQINLLCIRVGEMQARQGMATVTFED